MSNFGKRITELRERADLSTAELARRAGIGRAKVMRMEGLDDPSEVTLGNLTAIARALSVQIDALITEKVVAAKIDSDLLTKALSGPNGGILKKQISRMSDEQVAKAVQFLYLLETGSPKPETEKQDLFNGFLKAIL